jgi:hypothetical protein
MFCTLTHYFSEIGRIHLEFLVIVLCVLICCVGIFGHVERVFGDSGPFIGVGAGHICVGDGFDKCVLCAGDGGTCHVFCCCCVIGALLLNLKPDISLLCLSLIVCGAYLPPFCVWADLVAPSIPFRILHISLHLYHVIHVPLL